MRFSHPLFDRSLFDLRIADGEASFFVHTDEVLSERLFGKIKKIIKNILFFAGQIHIFRLFS